MRKGTDIIIFSPLLLLLFIPSVIGQGRGFEEDGSRAFMFSVRYMALPLAGFSIGACLFLAALKGRFDNVFTRYSGSVSERKWLLFASLGFVSLGLAATELRYFTMHDGLFDLGVYDNKIWRISMAEGVAEKLRASTVRHFQPVLIFYGFLYGLGFGPWAIGALQVLVVASGAYPLYLIARQKLQGGAGVAAVVLLYFLYTSTQFNAVLDFRPDHLIIPVLMWSFYFIEKENYLALSMLLLFGLGIKEPLILTVGLAGLYAALRKKAYVSGVAIAALSTVFFYVAAFVIVPSLSSAGVNQAFSVNPAFGHLAGYKPIGLIIDALSPSKLRFPFFVLMPLLCLPLLKPKEFMPALPVIGFALVSGSAHHQNVASHYTAAIVPAAFYAFICAVAYLRERFGNRVFYGILMWTFALNIAFNVAHSPSFLSIAFWNKDWSQGVWHYSNYLADAHGAILAEAVSLIPEDPKIKVVTHSRVYHPRLSHRYFYEPFTIKWREADYILIDDARGPYAADNLDEKKYSAEMVSLEADASFKKIFEKDGVMVFKKT